MPRRTTASARALVLLLLSTAAGIAADQAAAASDIQYGVQDDAWLLYGRGTFDAKADVLERMGVDLVRFTIRWDHVAPRRPASARDHADRAYDWRTVDPALRGLRRRGIDAVVTLLGTPRWANAGRPFNFAPASGRAFADFAYATARRYPWIRKWTIWNEPNQARWLRPTSAAVYVKRLLNPAYAELHAATPGARVAGGVTAPRAGAGGGLSPVDWIRAMGAAGARLDAYAHHPYPIRPLDETPWSGGCPHCSTITLADLERLLREVERTFGATRIWLTEYGYQTNPPDRMLGVSPMQQASHVAEAARRAYLAPRVEMLIQFLVLDETRAGGWQSGLFTTRRTVKPAYWAFRTPLTQVHRRGSRVDIWGQIRPGSGRQPYRLRLRARGRSRWLGGVRWTNERGFLIVTVAAGSGSRLQVHPLRARRPSLALQVR